MAYILNRFNLGTAMGGSGLAKDMGPFLRGKGFTQTYTRTPGAVVIFKPPFGYGVDSSAGHVGVIANVSASTSTWSINIQDANWYGDEAYGSGCNDVGFHVFTYPKSYGTTQIEYWLHP